MGTLHGKTAVILGVLGVTNRIGHATARSFVPEGAEVVMAVPDDVAGAAVRPASDEPALVTGQDLAIDGGLSVGPLASAQAKARVALAWVLAGTAGRPDTPSMQPDAPGGQL